MSEVRFKVTKVEPFEWEPYELANGEESDTMVGNSTLWREGEGSVVSMFETLDQYKVTIISDE